MNAKTLLLLAACLVVASGVGFVISYRPLRPLEFRPNVIVPTTVPIEGDTVMHKMTLHNTNSFPVRLGQAQSSCGCSSVRFDSGQEFTAGQVLPARSSIGLAISVFTGGQVMPRQVRVQVPATTLAGRPVPMAEVVIEAPVKGGPRIAPMALIFQDVQPEQQAARELVISDGQDEPVVVKEVKFSDPSRFAYRLIPVGGSERRSQMPMKPAHRLIVTYRSSDPAELSTEYVELVFEPKRFAPLRVPVYVRSSQAKAGFFPVKLVLIPQDRQTKVNRKVTLKTGSGTSHVKVVSHPPFVSVKLGAASGDSRELELEIDIAALITAGDQEKLVVSVGEGKEYELPIKALALK